MLKTFAIAVTLATLGTGALAASNYAQCLLDRLAGSANEATTGAAVSLCLKEHPGAYSTVKKGVGQSLFFNTSSDTCTLEKAKGVTNNRASFLIAGACKCLYDSPVNKGDMCFMPVKPNVFDFIPLEGTLDTPPKADPVAKPVTPAPQAIPPSPAPIVRSPGAVHKQTLKPDQAQIDLENAAQQAVIDYPFLDTPEGAEALRKIMERRDAMIAAGTYPAIALRRAVNAVAPGYADQLGHK